MRTVQFKKVLWACARRCGLDPQAGDFGDLEAAQIALAVNRRVRMGWEFDFWPEWTVTEERAYRDAWDVGTTYAIGDEVYYAADGKYYAALAAGAGHVPPSSETYWSEIEDLDKYVALDQTGLTALGEVREVSTRNPNRTEYPGFLHWWQSGNGVQVSSLAGATVYVTYRLRPPEFTSEEWASGATYAAGDLVYHAGTGECWKALQASTGQTPADGSAYWSKVEFPWVLEQYVIQGVYADWLRHDGQTEKAVAEDDNATDELMRAHDVAFLQQHGAKRAEVEVG